MEEENNKIKMMQALQIIGKKIDKFNGNGDHEDPVLSESPCIDVNPPFRSFLTDSDYAEMYICEYNNLLKRLNELP